MEQKKTHPMTYFDSITTPPHLYSLKMMLPYTPSSLQRILAIYIKFTEFQYTLEHFHGFPASSHSKNILEDLKSYMSPEEQEQLEQMQNILNIMDMMQGGMSSDMQEIFSQYSDLFEQELTSPQTPDSKGGSDHERMDESSGNEKS